MQTTQVPYEFLARWDQAGNYQGAQVQYRFVVRDDAGNVVTEGLGPVLPVKEGGFPLADIMTEAQAGAVRAAADAAEGQQKTEAAARAQREADAARIAALEQERDALKAECRRLTNDVGATRRHAPA